MRIITAYISLFGNIGALIFVLFMTVYAFNFERYPEQFFIILGVVLLTVSTIYLIISEKLYRKSESEKIQEENRVLQLKIEQMRLKKSLDEA